MVMAIVSEPMTVGTGFCTPDYELCINSVQQRVKVTIGLFMTMSDNSCLID